jgi:hypothetical protein
MKTIIYGSKIMTLGVLMSISPLPSWAMVAVLTAGMIYNFRASIHAGQRPQP